MPYMLLIYHSESAKPVFGDPNFDSHTASLRAFVQEMSGRGILISGQTLEPIGMATTVQVRHGQTETIIGSMTEPPEQLGGFYIMDCRDLDDAIQCAAKIPAATYGRIEIRPMVTHACGAHAYPTYS